MKKLHYKITQPVTVSVDVTNLMHYITKLILNAVNQQAETEETDISPDIEDGCFAYHMNYYCNAVVHQWDGTDTESPEYEETRSIEELNETQFIQDVMSKFDLNQLNINKFIKIQLFEHPADAKYEEYNIE